MRFKLDENFGVRCAEALSEAGHDVATVVGQGMSGSSDDELLGACKAERRCLVSLDLDFANPLHFPPAEHPGIVVVRPPSGASYDYLVNMLALLGNILLSETVAGRLLIVEHDRMRWYRPEED